MLFDTIATAFFYPQFFSLSVLVFFIARALFNKYSYGITSIKGPRLAAYTNLWRLWVIKGWKVEQKHIELHRKYGSIVRLGPNVVSVSDPRATKIIYALNAGWVKSNFYPVQQPIAKNGTPVAGIFSTTDEKYHAKLRRSVANAYAMSSLVQFEPLVDSTIAEFLRQLSERYADRDDNSGICDFSAWLQYYAFDVIGELTFSKRLGFVDRGEDVEGIIRSLEWMLNYFAVVGQAPILHRFLLRNPIRILCGRLGFFETSHPAVVFARQRMADRLHNPETPQSKHAEGQSSRDFLSRFLEAHDKDPAFMNQARVLALTSANMMAGSDTTASTLRAIFYFLLRNPPTLERLMKELDRTQFRRDDGLVDWNEVRDLPYLSAVIKEALRCFPAAGLPLERIVPPSGVTICGKFLPGGTIVGCSAWTIHQDEDIFGLEPDKFKPERWLEEGDSESSKRIADMNSYLFSFGGGSHSCIGKNISYLEIYKLVPAVLRRFKIMLAYPEETWVTHNAWFIKQSNFYVRLTTRTRLMA